MGLPRNFYSFSLGDRPTVPSHCIAEQWFKGDLANRSRPEPQYGITPKASRRRKRLVRRCDTPGLDLDLSQTL